MPSDEQAARIRDVLAGPRKVFRSALATTLEQIRGALETQRSAANGGTDGQAVALGAFATGRVDFERFATLLNRTELMDTRDLARVESAYARLAELAGAKEELFTVDVEPGGYLRDVVGAALARIGTAFGAARLFELTRSGRFREAEHAGLLDALPFERWNAAERELAPPLLVLVHGKDLHAEELARFLDGAAKLVLFVRGDAPPAPLVRLITPQTFVLQTGDGAGLERLAAWPGAGIAAWLPEGAARFVHDPGAGTSLADRLDVQELPEARKPRRLGGRSSHQQAEELAQLAALASRVGVGAGAGGVPAGDPVDRLASWLLRQSNLEGLG